MRFGLVTTIALCLVSLATLADEKVDSGIYRAPIDTQTNRKNLIGTWFLSQPTTNDGLWRVLSKLSADGTYTMKFEEYQDGRIVQSYVETGLWGVSANIHFTITQGGFVDGRRVVVPPDRPGNYLAYRIEELNESTFVYQSVVSENRFTASKVPDNFRMPKLDSAIERQ